MRCVVAKFSRLPARSLLIKCITMSSISFPASLVSSDVSSLVVDNKIKAFGITEYNGPLQELSIELKPLVGRQISVKIIAVSVNPVDGKIRKNRGVAGKLDQPKILGYDGSGVVVGLGPEASLYKVGDLVMFSGDARKNGTNSDITIIDEQLVGRMPKNLTFAKAAGLPLTAITAWEGLFEELGLVAFDAKNRGKRILVLPGAGGVGSLVIPLAAKLLGLTVIATASRPETVKQCHELGASVVINHRLPLKEQLDAAGIDGVEYIYNSYDTATYWEQYSTIIKPFGKIVSIVGATQPVNLTLFMFKRVSFHWEYMFGRSTHEVDIIQQHYILEQIADLIENGVLNSTTSVELPYTLENLQKAHELVDSGTMTGKVVLSRELL